jgi:hypothetical protein
LRVDLRVKEESELPSLTPDQLDVLRRYALFEAGLEEVRAALAGVFEFDLKPQRRRATTSFRVPEPGIFITREHIANALERKRFELISERELVEWATILLLNDAYVLDPGDEDLIAEWLNDISVNLDLDRR